MASVTIRGLDDAVKLRIQQRARDNGRSLESELRRIITQAADAEPGTSTTNQMDIGSQIMELFRGNAVNLEIPMRDEYQRTVSL
jgi:plasmid stability protein